MLLGRSWRKEKRGVKHHVGAVSSMPVHVQYTKGLLERSDSTPKSGGSVNTTNVSATPVRQPFSPSSIKQLY